MTLKVLIADDQQLLRAGFRLILERQAGVEVLAEATDGSQAVAHARAHHPDVIRMPGIDGIQATRLILADPATAHARIIILTTYDLDEYVYEALRAGASGFSLKDLPPEQLVAAVGAAPLGDINWPPPPPAGRSNTSLPPADRPNLRPPSPGSPCEKSGSSTRSRRGCRTPRSPPDCSWPKPPSRRTSPESSPSWDFETGCKRWSSPTNTTWLKTSLPNRLRSEAFPATVELEQNDRGNEDDPTRGQEMSSVVSSPLMSLPTSV
jgi:DNA-binding NarL/FixJ family response regulator